ncbi:tetratricopeptide repeat protein [Mangrovicoccus algicola]|uniref:Tetratricopeptide repeat protein n=1 Tax=Mangrovicoccus algicola TaxID=2771008 RepID=A0A8J6Z294_9RHOB|nr:hypothetical protein [Mangrovicoccus algicola]MBE3640311.1 hypothetical protein [Mangrovicoccus algicola]
MIPRLPSLCLAMMLAAAAAPADQPGAAPQSACPPPMEFAGRKADLLAELQHTRSRADGLFLTRHLVEIFATAPNRDAQKLLEEAVALRRAHAPAAAEQVLGDLIAYCPDFAEGYRQRALLRRQTGDLDGALADLDRALVHAPDHLAAMAGRLQVLIELDRTAEAGRTRDALLALNPWMPLDHLEDATPGLML